MTEPERRHGLATALAEHSPLLEAYPSLGYESLYLPKIAVAERADFILRALAEWPSAASPGIGSKECNLDDPDCLLRSASTGSRRPVPGSLGQAATSPDFSVLTSKLMPNRLELLSELVPQAKVIAFLVNPNNAATERAVRVPQEAARAKGCSSLS